MPGGAAQPVFGCICFAGLAVNNILLFLDLVIFVNSIDLRPVRNVSALLSISVLLHGLISESR